MTTAELIALLAPSALCVLLVIAAMILNRDGTDTPD